MTSLLPKIPAVASEPAITYSKPAEAVAAPSEAAKSIPKLVERRPSSQDLSSTDVAYVRSLMGLIPAQKMDEILLRTGIPMPANLGLDVDTAA